MQQFYFRFENVSRYARRIAKMIRSPEQTNNKTEEITADTWTMWNYIRRDVFVHETKNLTAQVFTRCSSFF